MVGMKIDQICALSFPYKLRLETSTKVGVGRKKSKIKSEPLQGCLCFDMADKIQIPPGNAAVQKKGNGLTRCYCQQGME